MAMITGMASDTIRRGWRELDDELQQQPVDRICHQGGGRLPTEKTPVAVDSLNSLLETQTAGDPLSRKKWVRCSLRLLE
ncbi:MAG: hypothetical protein R2867_09775 [Caldilineaceae bacterium]